MDVEDRELLRAYRRGEVGGLARLVEKYRRPLYGYIVRMTEGGADADEVFQEVWFRVIRKLRIYREKNFGGWLMRIAHNIVIDRSRRRKADFSLDDETEGGARVAERVAGREPDPARNAVAQDLRGRIGRAVASLPVEQREVFILRTEAEMPFKEIARLQRVSINTALARMQYALAKLRPALRTEYEELDAG
jgi:RNA polymerase sigma-70 factor, ECF subfamily